MKRALLLFVALFAACVPPENGLEYGSAEFVITATRETTTGTVSDDRGDPFTINFERVLLSFDTMTIGRIVGGDDECSFRGRAERSDIVFDPRFGNAQAFNGVKGGGCPDVGIILQPPGSRTEVGAGATVDDLLMLAGGDPAHAYVEAVARNKTSSIRVKLRFATSVTSSEFGGCSGRQRGTRIVPNARTSIAVMFAAERIFGSALSPSAPKYVSPFVAADVNADGVVTMEELDGVRTVDAILRVPRAQYNYEVEDKFVPVFGTWVRETFRRAFVYDEVGGCLGNPPGSTDD